MTIRVIIGSTLKLFTNGVQTLLLNPSNMRCSLMFLSNVISSA